ncbi:hypothetical protein [Paremcibacter congregatus]|uniref:hypothetical protein n=1 Tax=Paremcibacter congregatus TaxID=2043170 RepID=UPI001122B342|nr:hypothetical protein [Paremcibacter congregatus]QDE27278.1 hypothetical protein FIV45_08260 [Paremcibacter congregatus]
MSRIDPDIPGLPFRNFEHSGRELFSQVNKIPPEAAKSVAELFEKIAGELHEVHQTFLHQKAITAESKKNIFKLKQLPVQVQECLNVGMSFEEAVSHLKTTTGAPQTTIYSYWLRHIKQLEKDAFQVRDRQVWEMYNEGLPDQEIADLSELSKRQVQRIIREHKKRAP